MKGNPGSYSIFPIKVSLTFNYKPQEYNQGQLEMLADNVKSDRTADDLLAQVMLDWKRFLDDQRP